MDEQAYNLQKSQWYHPFSCWPPTFRMHVQWFCLLFDFVKSIIWAELQLASSSRTLTSGKSVQQCSNEALVRC